eukprot:gb/GECG01008971.1/.p1 GENE.gb/GECG01008971.1/~~gb/GECG01008971.1/.p1  ORF type:complete len:119 (+),score=11.10 gb/GECG01008971.1/:1-357(+)
MKAVMCVLLSAKTLINSIFCGTLATSYVDFRVWSDCVLGWKHSTISLLYMQAYADDAFLHHPFEFKYEDVCTLCKDQFEYTELHGLPSLQTWNFFFNWFQNVSAYKAYMACPGNHEGV